MFFGKLCEMQNSKCKVQNCGVSFGNNLKFIGEADTFMLHFACYILHSGSAKLKFTYKKPTAEAVGFSILRLNGSRITEVTLPSGSGK